jgi:hypothetical protein
MNDICRGCSATTIEKRGNGAQYVACVIKSDSQDITQGLHPECPIISFLKRATNKPAPGAGKVE